MAAGWGENPGDLRACEPDLTRLRSAKDTAGGAPPRRSHKIL